MKAVITGAGAVSPFGAGVGALRDGVVAGQSAVLRETTNGSSRQAHYVARVSDPLGPGSFPSMAWRRLDRCSRMAALAAAEAVGEAFERRADLGVVLGTMSSGVEPLRTLLTSLFLEGPESVSPMVFPFTVPNAPASQCSILLGLEGPNLTVCQMEASGLGAIAAGAMLIQEGAADGVLAGGVDEVSPAILEVWERMRILPRARPDGFRGPFDKRSNGFAPGEGAYVLLLESPERAARRGARPWAEVSGAATVHSSCHAHAWPENTAEPARAASLALERAGLRAADLAYVAASANGAPRLDSLEAEALRQTLGPWAERVPLRSLKGAVGESAAASAAAALLAALSIRDGFVPPLPDYADRSPEPRDGVKEVVPRLPVRAVLVNAIATGGTCISVVLKSPDA